jgi:hypothetical protein
MYATGGQQDEVRGGGGGGGVSRFLTKLQEAMASSQATFSEQSKRLASGSHPQGPYGGCNLESTGGERGGKGALLGVSRKYRRLWHQY